MDSVILAKDIILDGKLGASRPNDNQLVFGGTGTGKTFSTVIPNLLRKEDSLIATFAKGEYVEKSAYYLGKRGYKVHVWNLANPTRKDKIPDPLQYVRSEDDILELARQISNGNTEYSRSTKFDPYWRDAAVSLWMALITYIFFTEKAPSMKKVVDLFYKMQIEEYGKGVSISFGDEDVENNLRRHAPDSLGYKKYVSLSQLPFVTFSCVRDDVDKTIQHMFPTSILNSMSKEASIDFKKAGTEKTAILILTSPVRPAMYAYSNLIFSVAIRQLIEYAESREDNRLPVDVKLIFDDFSCGFPILDFEKSISTFRSAGISAMMLCQSISQLNTTYGEDKSTTIMDNCSSIVFYPGGLNKQTASYFSSILDLPLNDVMFMPMGNAVVLRSGNEPVIAPRYETTKDELFEEFMHPEKDEPELQSA